MTATYVHAVAGSGSGGGGDGITNLSGDVVATGPGSVPATIQANAVTYAKIQEASASILLGNPTGSSADIQEITLGTNLSFSGTVLNAAGSGSYFVNEFTLDGTDITNQFVTLTQTPPNPTLTVLNVVTGPVQNYSVDYTITGSQLSWSGLGLASLLNSGDTLIVQCN